MRFIASCFVLIILACLCSPRYSFDELRFYCTEFGIIKLGILRINYYFCLKIKQSINKHFAYDQLTYLIRTL